MKNLEIQKATNLPDGTTHQNVYVLDNGGGRIMKFVCRISQGEKLENTIEKAKQWISAKGTNVKYNEFQQRFAH